MSVSLDKPYVPIFQWSPTVQRQIALARVVNYGTPGHTEGLIMNDLVTLASLFRIMTASHRYDLSR